MKPPTEPLLALRPLTAADAERLAAIDAAAVDFPWRLFQFREGLAGREFGWGAENKSELIGFALCSLLLDEATLLNIAVHPDSQRRGIAWQLLNRAVTDCRDRGAARMLLEVRESNASAIALYRRAGFVIDGVRRDYYPALTGREAALLMSLPL